MGYTYMNYLILFLHMSLITSSYTLFNFDKTSSLADWTIVNDGVMGGVSQSEMIINSDGNAFFSGSVSLDYNGGFASVRYNPKTIDVTEYSKIVIRCKGPANKYQVRAKSSSRDRHSYIQYIEVSDDWKEIEVDMETMYPAFRGYELDIPNYPKVELDEFAILIGNKKYEEFELEIDWIELR